MNPNDRLKQVREHFKLSQKDFANALELKQSYYSEVEGGKREITSRIINSLIKNFHISSDWLLIGSGEIKFTNTDTKMNGFDERIDERNDLFPIGDQKVEEKATETPKQLFLRQHNYEKLIKYLDSSEPKYAKLFNNIDSLIHFRYLLDDIESQYFNDLNKLFWNTKKYLKGNNFDFESYKRDTTDELKKLNKFEEPLNNIVAAIDKFYTDFKEIDTKNVIKEYFGE